MMDPKLRPRRSNSSQSKLSFPKLFPVPGFRPKPINSSGLKKFPDTFRKWSGFGRKSKLGLLSDVISGSVLLWGCEEKIEKGTYQLKLFFYILISTNNFTAIEMSHVVRRSQVLFLGQERLLYFCICIHIRESRHQYLFICIF